MAEDVKNSTLPPRSETHGTKEEHKLTFFNKKGKKEVPAEDLQKMLPLEGQTLGRRYVPQADETATNKLPALHVELPPQGELLPTAFDEQPAPETLSRTTRGAAQSGPAIPVPSRSARRATPPAGALPPGKTPSQPSGALQKPSPLVMLVILLAVFMAVLDTSIVNVSLPKMMAVFGVGTSDIQWVLTAYTLVVGALVPVTGYIGDRFGYRKSFILALVIFTLGSGLCGAAWSNQTMIIFRIIQAIGGGALMPIAMSMIFRMFPPERRGAAMGLFGISIMFAPAIGPTLSGYITEYMNWRLIFYINVPIGILDFFLAFAVLKEVGQPIKRAFDLWGFLTSTIGFSTLLYGLGIVADKGWGDVEVITYLSIAVVSLLTFVMIEVSIKEPMLELRLLKNFHFTLTLLITSVTSVVLFGTLFLLPVFLQNVSGLSALQTGLLLLPQAIVTGIMMPISGALFDRFGARYLALIGLLLMAYSLYLTHNLDVTTSFGTIVYWLVIRAVGMGLTMMPVQTAGMNAIPMRDIGQGTALTNTVRQVAASFGIAWLTVLLSHRQIFHAAANAEQLNIFSPTATGALAHLQAMFAGLGPSGAKAMALKLLYGNVQMTSTVQAMDDVFFTLTWVTFVAIALSLLLKAGKRSAKKGGAPMMHE